MVGDVRRQAVIEYRTGDLFDQQLPAYGQGCNTRGLMGAGIARQFRRRWPAMYEHYRQACLSGRLQLGMMASWIVAPSPVIFSLATQDRPGPHARLDAIGQAVEAMLAHAEWRQLSAIGIPRIGAGIGGLAWTDVRKVLEDVAADSPVRLVVVTLPGETS